jgi:hypothetical protein
VQKCTGEENMSSEKSKILTAFFKTFEDMQPDDMMKIVEKHLSDDEVEIFVAHIEEFYGVQDDEELGMLAQLMVTGYLAGKHEAELNQKPH